ncbi:MAG: hypothetical protein HY319_28245 [Armatimonadetes bacterium]|nr:hypothetical protein [Armatimonadota bacterium]
MFSVEIYMHFPCARCGYAIKRRFLDYLASRTTRCPNCSVKMVHIARGQTPASAHVDMDTISTMVERLEGDWGSLVNEYLTHESRGWDAEEPGLA